MFVGFPHGTKVILLGRGKLWTPLIFSDELNIMTYRHRYGRSAAFLDRILSLIKLLFKHIDYLIYIGQLLKFVNLGKSNSSMFID